jgi:hypothetical protein
MLSLIAGRQLEGEGVGEGGWPRGGIESNGAGPLLPEFPALPRLSSDIHVGSVHTSASFNIHFDGWSVQSKRAAWVDGVVADRPVAADFLEPLARRSRGAAPINYCFR